MITFEKFDEDATMRDLRTMIAAKQGIKKDEILEVADGSFHVSINWLYNNGIIELKEGVYYLTTLGERFLSKMHLQYE